MGFLTRVTNQQSLAPSSLNQSVPSPRGGWNVRDPKDAMEPTDAVVLQNWFPQQYYLETRKGYTAYADTLGGAVESLAVLFRAGNEKMIAAANGNIWDTSASGAGVSLASGFTNNQWQSAQFDIAGDGNLVLVNGYDAPQIYNGTTVTAATISGTGLTVANLYGCHAFKNRMWYWERAGASGAKTQSAWYSAAGAITGTLTRFDFGQIQGIEGNIVKIDSWTVDGGTGIDDYFVVIFSNGRVLVYQGTDPAVAANWQLQGVYRIGNPLGGPRCTAKLGPELIVITDSGYYPMSKTLGLDLAVQTGAISDKIYGAVSSSGAALPNSFGWQSCLWPKGNMMIFNVPTSSAVTFNQHVMNTVTGAWAEFRGYNACSWTVYGKNLYFGDPDGNVRQAYNGLDDLGAPINAIAQQAYIYLGDNRSQIKALRTIRPSIEITNGNLAINASMQFDFKDRYVYAAYNIDAGASSPWGSPWNTTPWGNSGQVTDGVILLSGIGRAMSLTLNLNTQGQQAFWYSTAYHYELGGYF